MLDFLVNTVTSIKITDIIDILIIAFIFYKFIVLIKETRAEQLVKGILVLLIATKLSEWIGLRTVNWILRNTMTVGVIAILIVFQPELRKALERLGTTSRFFKNPMHLVSEEENLRMIEEVVDAVGFLSNLKIGALIVIERETGLNEIIETGIKIEGHVSSELLINIFIPNTPLHDGAVVIRGNKIMSAASLLPLTENININKNLGTRHRAGIGISEVSDAVAVIVSEETGTISIAKDGKLTRYLDSNTLKEILVNLVIPQGNKSSNWFKWGNKNEKRS